MTHVDGPHGAFDRKNERGPHGFRTTPQACPLCGGTGHEAALVLGVRAMLCPHAALGEVRAMPTTTPHEALDRQDPR